MGVGLGCDGEDGRGDGVGGGEVEDFRRVLLLMIDF